jgi:D-3-phosphoglycerate dehydrogenase / 2-oxoglutarate reductase
MSNTSYPKDKVSILFLENVSDKAVQFFSDNGYTQIEKISGALSEEELINRIKDVHILGIRSKTQISEKVLQAATKLQAIGCFCIGVNQVDLKAATRYGVFRYLMRLTAIPGVWRNWSLACRSC